MKNVNKEYKLSNLIKKLILLRKDGLRIGFTNGCVDLLQKGHLYSISEAKKRCDYLIIGLNSDISVASLKGSDRPIDNQLNRVLKLSKLSQPNASSNRQRRGNRQPDRQFPSPEYRVITSAPRGLCVHPCMFVCLSVSRITQKRMDRFPSNFVG